MSTILLVCCYIVDMTTKDMMMETDDMIYEIPNLGCLLGMAYQSELSRLGNALNDAGLDITAAEYIIMRLLYARGEMQQCEISRILNKDRASISRSIKFLEKKGIVRINQLSYKCSIVSLTESGDAMKPRIFKIAGQLQQSLNDRITPQQISILSEILKQIIK